jgi:hypothetical protein
MKKHLLIFNLLSILITTTIHGQISRYDQQVERDYSMNYYIPNNNLEFYPECLKAKKMINEIVSNMELIATYIHENKAMETELIDYDAMVSIKFYNSNWIKEAYWFNLDKLFKSPFIEIKLLNGEKYYYPNVPKSVFNAWQFSSSPGDYYHENIKKYSLIYLMPEFCH